MLEKIKTLRVRTNAGIGDCQKALKESDGDIDLAAEWLRKKNIAKADSKKDRIASKGLVGVKLSQEACSNSGSIIEVNSETDFVSRNEVFQKMVHELLDVAQKNGAKTLEDFFSAEKKAGQNVQDFCAYMSGILGENLVLRRFHSLKVDKGVVVAYVHQKVPLAKTDFSQGLGQVGTLIALESEGDVKTLEKIGQDLAMHIVSSAPGFLKRSDVSSEIIEKEKEIAREKAIESGVPEAYLDKAMDKSLSLFFSEKVLEEQKFVLDTKKTVDAFIKEESQKLGAPITIKEFVLFEMGA